MTTRRRRLVGGLLLCLAIPLALIAAVVGCVVGLFTIGEPLWAVGVLTWVVVTLAGWIVFEGKKQTVLFLRKFGPNEASKLLKESMLTGRNRFRVVTLDDRAFQPVVVEGGYVFWSFTSLIPVIMLMLLLLAVSIPETGDTPLASGQVNLLILCASAGPVIQLLIRLLRRGTLSRIIVPTAHALPVLTRRVRALQSWDFAPQASAAQMTVASVDDSYWPAAVTAIGQQATVIVIDISDFTANLEWELTHALSSYPWKVLITRREQSPNPLPASFTAAPVFTYEPDNKEQYRAAAMALLARLDERATARAG